MTQLALDLHTVAPPTLENFVVGANAECLACLRALAAGERGQRLVYLWGQPGSGRSHLLRALAGGAELTVAPAAAAAAAAADAPTGPTGTRPASADMAPDMEPDMKPDTAAGSGARLLGPQTPLHRFAATPACTLYLADDVQRMDAQRQAALFHLINQVRADPAAALVASGDAPPLGLALRDDLRTRLGWGLVFELHLLSDDEKAAALRTVAAERGVPVAADVIPWLLTHRSRDIRVLLALFDALDRHAFSRKRPITLPLLREWLRSDEGRRFGEGTPDRQD